MSFFSTKSRHSHACLYMIYTLSSPVEWYMHDHILKITHSLAFLIVCYIIPHSWIKVAREICMFISKLLVVSAAYNNCWYYDLVFIPRLFFINSQAFYIYLYFFLVTVKYWYLESFIFLINRNDLIEWWN